MHLHKSCYIPKERASLTHPNDTVYGLLPSKMSEIKEETVGEWEVNFEITTASKKKPVGTKCMPYILSSACDNPEVEVDHSHVFKYYRRSSQYQPCQLLSKII